MGSLLTLEQALAPPLTPEELRRGAESIVAQLATQGISPVDAVAICTWAIATVFRSTRQTAEITDEAFTAEVAILLDATLLQISKPPAAGLVVVPS